MTPEQARGFSPGLYVLEWTAEEGGGTSLASVGLGEDGGRWYAPSNWILHGDFPADYPRSGVGWNWAWVKSARPLNSKAGVETLLAERAILIRRAEIAEAIAHDMALDLHAGHHPNPGSLVAHLVDALDALAPFANLGGWASGERSDMTLTDLGRTGLGGGPTVGACHHATEVYNRLKKETT